MGRRAIRMRFAFAVVLFALSPLAHAALGEAGWSLETDRQALKGGAVRSHARPPGSTSSYTIKEIPSDSATIREYLNADGIIFAVAWKGRAHPELSALLGSFYDDFKSQNRSANRRRGRNRVRGNRKVVHGSRVVVERYGRMRALAGRAYVPALLPRGMKPDEIR